MPFYWEFSIRAFTISLLPSQQFAASRDTAMYTSRRREEGGHVLQHVFLRVMHSSMYILQINYVSVYLGHSRTHWIAPSPPRPPSPPLSSFFSPRTGNCVARSTHGYLLLSVVGRIFPACLLHTHLAGILVPGGKNTRTQDRATNIIILLFFCLYFLYAISACSGVCCGHSIQHLHGVKSSVLSCKPGSRHMVTQPSP